MDGYDQPLWIPPPVPERRRKSHKAVAVAGVLGVGVAAGAALAFVWTANASSNSNSDSAFAGFAASSAQPHGPFGVRLQGAVTAVDPSKSTVTIKTSSGTTTYAVDSHSDIDKNGEASLSALKVGDAVTFSTVTTNGKATIAILHSGDEAKNQPSGGGHGFGQRGLALSGTVTSVDTGKSTVTIKTSSGTTTYAVDSHSDIDKNGEASLSALKAGDAVRFSTVATNGKATIAILHSGDEAKNRPAQPPAGPAGFGNFDGSGTDGSENG